jgi:hypothetical protein
MYAHMYALLPCDRGELTVRGEAVTNTRDILIFTLAGNKLSNKDGFFGKSGE